MSDDWQDIDEECEECGGEGLLSYGPLDKDYCTCDAGQAAAARFLEWEQDASRKHRVWIWGDQPPPLPTKPLDQRLRESIEAESGKPICDWD